MLTLAKSRLSRPMGTSTAHYLPTGIKNDLCSLQSTKSSVEFVERSIDEDEPMNPNEGEGDGDATMADRTGWDR